jgi:hypothetical protein
MGNSGKHYDLMYIDPSRRSSSNKKVFQFADCEPDVVALGEELFSHADRVMVKASPLLDIQQGIKDLQHVNRVLVVSVDNECKELLFLCNSKLSNEPIIECYNLSSNFSGRNIPGDFEFKFSDERSAAVSFSDPLKYVFEPNASIMKSGAFKSIANEFRVQKISSNTHLYTSNELAENFPGRVFRVDAFVKPDKKLRGFKANVVLRNYPLSVDEMKKKTGVVDGGDKFLIGCSGVREKWLFTADRVR